MRKLIMWNLLTLDGYFEGSTSWALDWHNEVWGGELERFSLEQLRTADLLLFGRVTYEGMAAYWKAAAGEIAGFMNRIPKIVFSRTLKAADWKPATLLREVSTPSVLELKRGGDGNMFVFGSGSLSAALIREGLFDEYRLLVAPVILGSGSTLFGRGLGPLGLRLLDAKALASGGVLLRYVPR